MAPGKIKKKAASVVDASSKPSTSGAKTPKSLKPGPKITKKSPNQNSAKTRKANTTPQVLKKPEDEKKNGKETNKETSTSNPGNDEKKPKPQERHKTKNPLNQNSAKAGGTNITPQVQAKYEDEKKNRQDANKETSTSNQRNYQSKPKSQERNKEKSITDEGHNEKRQRDHKKEKLGGLIMMCNGKTKPDCFRYRVMGVPIKKKEVVMGIRPGLKLFLYDFDLKLLYGIYTASSAGGMKLEPNAFDGVFPVQVRFKVHKDCCPLPEHVFKKAIKGYNEKSQRFKTELTVQQVNKLADLFRPVQQQQSNACSFVQAAPATLLVHPPRLPILPVRETSRNRSDPQSQVDRDRFKRDQYSPEEEWKYYIPGQERKRFSRHPASTRREMASGRKEALSDDPLFLSEKDYRTYGLGRAQHATTSPVRISSLDPYQNDHRREQLHSHATSIHKDIVPTQKEEHSSDPLFLSEKDYRTYGLGRELPLSIPPAPGPSRPALDLYSKEPNYTYRYGAASSDPYSLLPATSSEPYTPLTTETHLPTYLKRGTTDHLLKRGGDERKTLYSTYASTSLLDYNQRQHPGRSADHTSGSVSSKYAFPRPSVSYH